MIGILRRLVTRVTQVAGVPEYGRRRTMNSLSGRPPVMGGGLQVTDGTRYGIPESNRFYNEAERWVTE